MFLVADQVTRADAVHVWAADCSVVEVAAGPPTSSTLDLETATEVLMSTVDVGQSRYRFLKELIGRFSPKPAGPGVFRVWETGDLIVGRGATVIQACEHWQNLLHMHFQRLYGLRRFQMSPEDRTLWDLLTSVVDVPAYQATTPLVLTEVGMISRARPWPSQVTWVNGDKESVNPRIAPGPFAAFKPGQWFEALVKRDPITKRLIALVEVRRIPSVRPMTPREQSEFWNSLESTKSLPSAGHAWASR